MIARSERTLKVLRRLCLELAEHLIADCGLRLADFCCAKFLQSAIRNPQSAIECILTTLIANNFPSWQCPPSLK